MTENEAIERLECMRLFMQIEDERNESKFLEDDYIANKMAIKALEEIQQYRAIGTVEEFKALKEKAEPKKPKKKNSNKVIVTQDSYAYCPHCKNPVQIWNRSCEKCGGELDWH